MLHVIPPIFLLFYHNAYLLFFQVFLSNFSNFYQNSNVCVKMPHSKNFEKIKERTTRCSSRYSSFNKYSNNSKLPSSSLTKNSGCHCKPIMRCSSIDSIASIVWSLGSIAVTRKLGAKSLIL